MTHFLSTLSGLGDAVLAYPAVKALAASAPVSLATEYPEVFAGLPNVSTTREKTPAAVTLRYTRAAGSNYYLDICKAAGVAPQPFIGPAQPRFEFPFKADKPVCLVKEPSAAHMDRTRRDYRMAPAPMLVQNWLFANRGRFYFVAVQHDTNAVDVPLVGVDYRFSGRTVAEYLSLCASVDHIASQIGHLLPIAQAFNTPFTVFKPRGPLSGFVQHISPGQVLVPPPYANAPEAII